MNIKRIDATLGRLLLAGLIFLAGYGLLLSFFVNSYRQELLDARRDELRRIVDLGLTSLEPLLTDEVRQVVSNEELRREAAINLRELTYRFRLGENYLFMGTYDGLILVEPYAPELEYTYQWERVDADGYAYIQAMVQTAQSSEGAGFVEFRAPFPGENNTIHRLAYITALPDLDAYLGASMNLAATQEESQRYLLEAIGLAGVLVAGIFTAVAISVWPLVSSYGVLSRLFTQMGRFPLSQLDVPLDRFRVGSQPWNLLNRFQEMLGQLQQNQQIREEAALAERSRLARELHDAVSQTLFSAQLIADVLPDLWERKPKEAREQLEVLGQLTRGALAEMRTLLFELRPDRLAQVNLVELLRQLSTAIQGRGRVVVVTDLVPIPELPIDIKIGIYRIAQEALNNVIKHAQASKVEICLQKHTGSLVLSVEDDGKGFDHVSLKTDRLGLLSMRERAEAMGGQLTIVSRPREGTRIELQIPWVTVVEN